MARTAAAGFWSLGRACARTVQRCLGAPSRLAAGLILIGLTFSGACQADPVKGEATFSAAGGYARLVLKLAEDVGSEVTAAGSILVIRFKRPVDIPVDKLSDAVPDYVGSARRDPDGSAIRLSLARRVTINTMTAGERVFVDLLPDTWSGQPPGLPPEVIRELAERARTAERALRQQLAATEAKKKPPIRVRASVQPTFVRFVFEMPDGVGASSVLNDQKLTLAFNALLTFDMADAKIAAPPNIASINQRVEGDTTLVDIVLIGDVDVHPFREDKNYNIDVAFQQPEKAKAQALPMAAARPPADKAKAHGSPAAEAAHATLPAGPAAAEKPAREPANEPASQSEDIVPPTSETIAQQMKMGSKPEQATTPAAEPDAQKSDSSSSGASSSGSASSEPPAFPAPQPQQASAERPSSGSPAK